MRLVRLIACMALLCASPAGATTYAVSQDDVAAYGSDYVYIGVAGSITTDGTLGIINSASHIIDWDLIGVVGTQNAGHFFNITGPLSYGNPSGILYIHNIVATPLTLEVIADDPLSGVVFGKPLGFVGYPYPQVYFQGEAVGITNRPVFSVVPDSSLPCSPNVCLGYIGDISNPDNFSSVFADGKALPTPLPAALPHFASGLGAIGWLAQRRKQKAAALAAA
jgi:hypothetical protein